MKIELIDAELIKAYHDECLWKDPDFYVSLLEHAVMQPDNSIVKDYVQRLVRYRQQFILQKTFGKDGSVDVTIRPVRFAIGKKILRYLPWVKGPRIEG